jgi:xanthosine phosphorylase
VPYCIASINEDKEFKMNNTLLAVKIIQQRAPHAAAKVAVILGSGAGPFVDQLHDSVVIPYEDLPGFPSSKVEGHHNEMHVGLIDDVPVICLKGRAHYYEGLMTSSLKTMIHTLIALGIEILIVTNAAGSLHKVIAPGSLAMICDHINFQGHSPLVGENDDAIGPRFISMENTYDEGLRAQCKMIAAQEKIVLHEGVYIATLGPQFETPAEINAFRLWGADLVGMSTVPEVILARHAGLRVLAISSVTNYAAGMTDIALSHQQTLNFAQVALPSLSLLLSKLLTTLTY